MDVLHFPDDARPPWLVHPVLALGNFDGLHRGHLKIVERVKRGAAEHGGTADGDDVRSPSAARGSPRQGAAAPDDAAAAPRRARARRHARRCGRSLYARAVTVGAGDVRAHRARGLAARVGSMGRRQLPFRPRSERQLLAAAHARSALRLSRRQDRPGALQGIRRQQHTHPAAGGGRPRGRGGRAARDTPTRWPARSSRDAGAAANWVFPRPTCRPTTS